MHGTVTWQEISWHAREMEALAMRPATPIRGKATLEQLANT
jgi:hypothetical protein